MELTIQQQVFEQINKARKILVALPENLNADSLGSGLAFKQFLTKLGKDVEIVSSGQVPEELKFLSGSDEVRSSISVSQGLVVVVEALEKQLDELSYQVEGGKLKIFLKAKEGSYTPKDISFEEDKFPLDLIVILECKNLLDLGELFKKYAAIFYEVSKINIDHGAGNEHFASVNFVDISASSIAEILTGLLEQYEKQLADDHMATSLLAGIITKTKSFQHVQTTPRAMMKASLLMSWGGRQQEVIKHLFKTKSLSLLRLWGRALARLRILSDRVAYSMLNASDFEKADADSSILPSVARELLDNMEGYDVLALMAGVSEDRFALFIVAHNQLSGEKFLEVFGTPKNSQALSPQPYKIFEYELQNGPLAEAETKLAEDLRKLV